MAALIVRNLGDFIRDQRRAAQISLRELAKQAGVSNPYLSQIERGLRKPSAEILQQIAKGLRISAEALYVQAGILEEREGNADLLSAVLTDAELTERQKQVILDIYEAFRRENAGIPANDAATPGAEHVATSETAPSTSAVLDGNSTSPAADTTPPADAAKPAAAAAPAKPRRTTAARTRRTTEAAPKAAESAQTTTSAPAASKAAASKAVAGAGGATAPRRRAAARPRARTRESLQNGTKPAETDGSGAANP